MSRTKNAVGALFLDLSSGRIGLAKRSQKINNPGVWHTTGGQIEPGESHMRALTRELQEELGYNLWEATKVMQLNKDTDYTTYLVCVDKPFEPTLNPENDDFAWFDGLGFAELPSNLHPRLRKVLKDPFVQAACVSVIPICATPPGSCPTCGSEPGANNDCLKCLSYGMHDVLSYAERE